VTITRIAFDASPLIYALERHPTFEARVRRWLDPVLAGELEGVVSSILYTELWVGPLKTENTVLQNAYTDLLEGTPTLRVFDVTPRVGKIAAALRSQYALKTPDALHLATALEGDADVFLTHDLRLKQVVEMEVWTLEDLV
jgi:predicted nucleic acid-binding protein